MSKTIHGEFSCLFFIIRCEYFVEETGGEMGKWGEDELVGEGFKAYVGRSVNRELERVGDVPTIILQAKCT